jgi:alpha-glucosidase (family GH31 glycosyl hydrolase)
MMKLLPTLLATCFALNLTAQIIDFSSQQNSQTDTFDLPWPQWVFEHWVWEDESTQESALQIVDDYIAHDIPVSAIIIDSPWETGYNTFEWDTALFHDAQAMIDSFHSRDVKVLLWITGIINIDEGAIYDDAAAAGYFMKTLPFDNNPAVVNWWKGDGSLIDWFNPDAVTWWKGLMDNMLDMGIDGWKCDGTDFSAIQTPWSDGANSFISRLDYSHAYYQIHFDYTREVLGDDAVIHARPIDNYGIADIGGEQVSFSPVQTGFATWVGDQDATFEGLGWALNNMYHSAAMGYLVIGSDIGAYRENDLYPTNGRSKELFIRWAQLGTFCGLMENGGGGEHRPWMFDQETEDIYHDLVEFRYETLVPYLMSNSEAYYNNEESLMQFFNNSDYSFMLGPDYFVAPFLEEGTNITVNFPAGFEWIYLYDNAQVYQGGTSESLTIPYSEYPVFVKGNALSVDEPPEAQVAIYPNPSEDMLNISIFENGVQNATIELFDISGKLLLSEALTGHQNNLDISALEAGIYQIRIQANEKMANRKIIKR